MLSESEGAKSEQHVEEKRKKTTDGLGSKKTTTKKRRVEGGREERNNGWSSTIVVEDDYLERLPRVIPVAGDVSPFLPAPLDHDGPPGYKKRSCERPSRSGNLRVMSPMS